MGIMAWLKERIVNLPKLFTVPIVDENQRRIDDKETSGERRAKEFLLAMDAWSEHIRDCSLCREQYRSDGNPSQYCSTGIMMYEATQNTYHADL